jgi:hypothetical protein
MSAQGGTLGRLGSVHVPIWPVATLIAAAIAGAIALSTIGQGVSTVDQGATTDAVFEQVTFPRGLENAGAYPAEVPVTSPVGLENPAAWAGISQITEATATYPRGLENPAAWAGISQITEATVTYPRGLENPGAYVGENLGPKADAHGSIEVNGTVCGQCR